MCFFYNLFFFILNFRALMEIQPPPIKMPSPTLSNTAVVSPEALSHHSSPAKTSRICYQPHPQMIPPQHQMIDETIGSRIPLSISTHHQLASAAIGTPGDHPHSSISGISGMHSDVNMLQQNIYRFRLWTNFIDFLLNVVRFGASTSVPKFRNDTNISDYWWPSFSIVIPFVTSSSPSSFRATSIAISTSTFTFATCRLYTATRNQSVCHQFRLYGLKIRNNRFNKIITFSFKLQISNVCNDTVSFIRKVIGCNGNRISNGRSYIYLHSTFILWSKYPSEKHLHLSHFIAS